MDQTVIKRLAAEGRTVLVSSHLMNEMAVTADHLIVIGRGGCLPTARSRSSPPIIPGSASWPGRRTGRLALVVTPTAPRRNPVLTGG